MLHDIVAHQTRQGVEAGILTFRPHDDSELYRSLAAMPGVRLHEIEGKTYSFKTLRKMRRVTREYDVVHAHLFPSGYFAAIAGAGKPLVYTEHSTHNRRRDLGWMRLIERMVYGRFGAIAAISEPVADALRAWLRSTRINKKIVTINNGVDLRRFSDTGAKPTPEEVFGRGGKAILMVSRFTAAKDHRSLIRALPLLEDREMFVAFAGEGDTMEECRRLADELGVADRCLFLGRRDDIERLAVASHIGVQASHWEGFGLTAVELMAAGLPVVASDVAGLRDIVGDAGMPVSPGDPSALAAAINRVAGDPTLREELHSKGLRRARDFDIAATAEAYLNLYRKLSQA